MKILKFFEILEFFENFENFEVFENFEIFDNLDIFLIYLFLYIKIVEFFERLIFL